MADSFFSQSYILLAFLLSFPLLEAQAFFDFGYNSHYGWDGSLGVLVPTRDEMFRTEGFIMRFGFSDMEGVRSSFHVDLGYLWHDFVFIHQLDISLHNNVLPDRQYYFSFRPTYSFSIMLFKVKLGVDIPVNTGIAVPQPVIGAYFALF
jgi:hypothetical protein